MVASKNSLVFLHDVRSEIVGRVDVVLKTMKKKKRKNEKTWLSTISFRQLLRSLASETTDLPWLQHTLNSEFEIECNSTNVQLVMCCEPSYFPVVEQHVTKIAVITDYLILTCVHSEL